jgi:hypothetical protein
MAKLSNTLTLLFFFALPMKSALSITDIPGCGYGFTASGTCPSGSGTFSVAAGSLIIVGLSAGSTGTNLTVTDNINGPYTLIGTTDNVANNRHVPAWYKVSSGGNVQVTVACPSCSQKFSIMIEVITGQATSNFIDQTDLTANSASAATCTSSFTRTGNQYIMQVGLAETVSSAVWSTATSPPGTVTIGSNTTNGNATEPGVISYQYITSGTSYTIAIGSGQTARTDCNGFSINEGTGASPSRVIHRPISGGIG